MRSRQGLSVLCGKTNVPTPIQDGQNQTEIFEFRAQKLAFQGSLAYLTETQTNFSNSFSFSRKPFYRFVTWIDLMEIFQEPNSSSDVQRRTVVAQKLAFLGSLSYLRESQTDLPNSVSSSRKDLRRFVTCRDGNLSRFVSLAFGLSPRSMTARQPSKKRIYSLWTTDVNPRCNFKSQPWLEIVCEPAIPEKQ